jgi:hypothetical protein
MAKFWNLIEAHYLIAAFLVWTIVMELSKIVRGLSRTIQFHPDYITNNHITNDNEGETEDEDEESDQTSSPNPILTQSRPQPIPHPGRRVEPVSSPGLLTRAERVIRNLKG